MAFGASASEVPTSSTTAQSQCQIMTLRMEHGAVQVPVDRQAGSKAADEKRNRNAAASHRFRQRRKEREDKTSENIARLEATVREMAEDRDHYLQEREYFQGMALRYRLPITPRPPSPRRRRHATLSGAPLAPCQEAEGSGRSGRQIRRRTSAYVPPQGPPPSTVEPSPIPSFERMTAMHS
ncbi:MAG: hypothetical protein Q9210_003525 [Variospora velana]